MHRYAQASMSGQSPEKAGTPPTPSITRVMYLSWGREEPDQELGVSWLKLLTHKELLRVFTDCMNIRKI